MTIFEEYPVTITASELKTATGLDLAEEMEQGEIAPFLQKVCLSVYEGGIYATGDRELKDRIIAAHYEKAETAIKRALIIQAEYEHGVGRVGTESGITITADGQKAVVSTAELRSKALCIDAVNALKACSVNLLYAGETE
jgi:hypothetical protein